MVTSKERIGLIVVSLKMIRSRLLCVLLLLISGIEPNPGPLTCRLCLTICETVLCYYEHFLSQHVSVPCMFSDCDFISTSLTSLQVHVSRHHREEQQHTAMETESLSPARLDASTETSTLPWPPPDSSTSQEVSCPLIHVSDCSPSNVVKLEILKFYLMLEGLKVLPSSTVQAISENIGRFTEMSHRCLKECLKSEMVNEGIGANTVERIVNKVFLNDPVFNVHHKDCDQDQMSSIHLRGEMMKEQLFYVAVIERKVGRDSSGKPKYAHFIPVRESLQAALKDPQVLDLIVQSFSTSAPPHDVLEDITSGSAYKEHRNLHEKCIYLIFFQDGFEFNPFGPAKGLYKSIGIYFTIGNLPAEHRSKVSAIFLACLIQERHLKPSEEESLQGVNKWKECLKYLLDELKDLQTDGMVINGETIPVCFLFCSGDNLGSHQIGSFNQSFSAQYFCRFCPITATEFKQEPFKCKALRTPQDYNESVQLATEMWSNLKEKSLILHSKRKEKQRRQGKEVSKTMVSKTALKNLQSVSHLGVKPQQSALNSIPGFHVCSPAMPPCLAHDLFEGIVDVVLAKVFYHCIEVKKWFSLEVLNRRIKSFQYRGPDAADAPNAIKSYDKVKGHACETWTLLRLLPFIIGDLIRDEEDQIWKLYLQLKEICEYVTAPKISMKQVAYLSNLIKLYLCRIKNLLPECLIPKHHYLCHYPALILIFGPLLRLFTMRFESRHVFFKTVSRNSHNFTNHTLTLAKKYQFRFAYDNINGIISPTVKFSFRYRKLQTSSLSEEVRRALPSPSEDLFTDDQLERNGITYKKELWMVLGTQNENDLCVGKIETILIYPNNQIMFVFRTHIAENTYQGYYAIDQSTSLGVVVKSVDDFIDFSPLQAYRVLARNQHCLSLKHSVIVM